MTKTVEKMVRELKEQHLMTKTVDQNFVEGN